MISKTRLALVVSALALTAGCTSGGALGGGVSPGHGSPKAAADGFFAGLENSGSASTACSYLIPSQQQGCQQVLSEAHLRVTGSFSFGNQVINGNEAIVVLTGNACVTADADATTSSECTGNSDPNTGLPSGGVSFADAYSTALGASSFASIACVKVNGQWYVNAEGLNGSSASSSPTTVPATTTPETSPATTTPDTSPATTTPMTSPATTTPVTSPATTTPGTVTPTTTPATTF